MARVKAVVGRGAAGGEECRRAGSEVRGRGKGDVLCRPPVPPPVPPPGAPAGAPRLDEMQVTCLPWSGCPSMLYALRLAPCALRLAPCAMRFAPGDWGLGTGDCGLRTADWIRP